MITCYKTRLVHKSIRGVDLTVIYYYLALENINLHKRLFV